MSDATITDARYTAEDIILDSEQWFEQDGNKTDDIYRILSEDGTAIDLFYESDGQVNAQFGHVYRYGGTNGIQLSFRGSRMYDRGQFLIIEHYSTDTKLEIDCHKVVSIGAIPWEMSLFGSNPRLVQ